MSPLTHGLNYRSACHRYSKDEFKVFILIIPLF